MKNKKTALFQSIISMLLCVSMLVGTTFAWFTDDVKSGTNVITAGNLDVQMYWTEDLSDTVWHNAEDVSSVPFDYDNWEPGYTQVRYVKIVNAGNLALKYSLTLGAVSTVGKLAEVIGVYYAEDVTGNIATRDLSGMEYLGLLKDTVDGGEAAYGDLQPGGETVVAVAMQMDTAAGNEYQGQPAGEFVFRLMATQQTGESDSFGDAYDADAGMMGSVIHYNVAQSVTDKTENGALTEAVTVGAESATIYAQAPSGVKLAEGAGALSLSVDTMTASGANVELDNGEVATSLDIHVDGLAEDNTVPVLVTLRGLMKTGLNSTSVAMYHVEGGATVAMTLTADPTNHNDFSYDPATGDVTVALAGFSEVVAVVDNKNLWEGSFDTTWYNTVDREFTLTSADQLAGFGAIVDGGYMQADGTKVTLTADTFAGKTVKLGANINLAGGCSLNPIGCGYAPETGVKNSNGVTGYAFSGMFDGQGHTISNLYQNGWELGLSYCNLGGGLFASIANGTVKNLTISGANIVMECVEMGVLVGLSQGSCTYENITIKNSQIANYQRATGGLIGEVSALSGGTTTISNVKIASDVVVGSLWGDFDCPVGGVIGARWDDSNTTTVQMKNVTVACRLDVYNDVTSSYQWYAYRRAGMLIGNTDTPPANGKDAKTATADFLTCIKNEDGTNTVKVYYNGWNDYHYCCFSNYNASWPWVRVEAGENCEAYSNPRYGVPTFDGNKITDAHTKADHAAADQNNCRVSIPFNQLYGGGQGVYGQPEHDGVDVMNYRYCITYINDDKVLDIRYITQNGAVTTKNEAAQVLVEQWAEENITGDWQFGGWMNAGSTKLEEIASNNTRDIELYPYFNKPYTARFVDQNGNVLAWCLFHEADLTKLDGVKDVAQSQLPNPGTDFAFDYWEVNANGTKVNYESANFASFEYDVTIYPVYRYTGNLKLTPVDEDNDGTIEYYKVEAVDKLDTITVIPGNVNGVPVKVVEKIYKNDGNTDYSSGVKIVEIQEGVERLEHNSISHTAVLELVKIPKSMKYIGKNAFSRNNTISGIFGGEDDKKTLTIEFNGTMAEWEAIEKHEDWANGLKKVSYVKCIDGEFRLEDSGFAGLGSAWNGYPY